MEILNHKQYCKKTGRCVKCGRYICKGCNDVDENGRYGLCMICGEKVNGIKNPYIVLLYPKPFIKPLFIKRYEDTVNNEL